MASPMKNWNPGVADAAWKVMVCARDAALADEVLSALAYILTDAGSNTELGLSEVSTMSGEQIIEGIKRYQERALLSVHHRGERP